MALKSIPKPKGHEMAYARANKGDGNAELWLPENALFDAYEELKDSDPVEALIICWYKMGTNGIPQLRCRIAGKSYCSINSLGVDIFHRITKGQI